MIKNDLEVQKAIEIIKADNLALYSVNEILSARDLAVEALKQMTTTKNDLGIDCISRADAIKAMQDKAKRLKNEDTINGLCGAVAILFELPSVTPQQRWIPVSERLPEEVGLYLVSVKNEHDRRYSKTCWFNGKNNWFARQDVVAWMPLPQAYREVEK